MTERTARRIGSADSARNDKEILQELVRRLRSRSNFTPELVQAFTSASERTGTHRKPCEISPTSGQTLACRGLARYQSDATLLPTIDPNFLEQVNRKKPRTMAQFADIWYTSQGQDCGRNQHYNNSRYHMLNYHATFTKGTIEFRLFQFDRPENGKKNGLHAGHLKSYIQLCLALSELAKELRTANPNHGNTRIEIRHANMADWLG
ncbi:MAG: amidoligase family protein [Ruminococcus sp.]